VIRRVIALAMKVECPACGMPPGEPCKSLTAYYPQRIFPPHRQRGEAALKAEQSTSA
jgi:hypothetical protein